MSKQQGLPTSEGELHGQQVSFYVIDAASASTACEAAECKAQSASDLKVTTDGLEKSKEMKASVPCCLLIQS